MSVLSFRINGNWIELMALEMRENCEKCNIDLEPTGNGFICTFECTFCTDCKEEMSGVCPNCGGELVARPKRKA